VLYKLATHFTQNFKLIVITRSALFSSKCIRNHLAAGFRPDPLGELPRPSWMKGMGPQEEGGEMGKGDKERVRGRKGE